jgi:hypothetical protein
MCRQLLLSVCSLAVLSSSANAADAIYSGGDILTMAGPEPAYVEALVVDQGRIVFTGAVSDAMKLKSSDTKIVDLQGHTLMPGFQDTHGHLLLKMHNLLKLDLTGAATPDEVAAAWLADPAVAFQAGEPPPSPLSSGKITVRIGERDATFFPHVFNFKWIQQ